MASPDVPEIARRHGVSLAAAETVAAALRATGGRSAQFSHPELGGSGQWMPGMVQIGDMFNSTLRAKVDALCSDLAGLIRAQPPGEMRSESPAAIASAPWWPAGLGTPDTAGGQNDVRYAWFASARRLAVQRGGRVTVYDTGDHRITGVSQQQQNQTPGSVVFSTERGTLDATTLPVV